MCLWLDPVGSQWVKRGAEVGSVVDAQRQALWHHDSADKTNAAGSGGQRRVSDIERQPCERVCTCADIGSGCGETRICSAQVWCVCECMRIAMPT